MRERKHITGGLIAAVVLFATIAALLWFSAPADAPAPSTQPGDPASISRLRAMSRTLLVSVLLLLAFLFGSWLIVRIGQRMRSTRADSTRTEYIDAWSSYRLLNDDDEPRGAAEDPRRDEDDERPGAGV